MYVFLTLLMMPLTYWLVLAAISVHRDTAKGRL